MLLQRIKEKKRSTRCNSKLDINKDQMKLLLLEGAILLDVRSPQEYEEGHLDNAILMPHYEIKQKAEIVLKNKSRDIIVYCSTGYRSKKTQKLLKKMGYEKVYNLYGGV